MRINAKHMGIIISMCKDYMASKDCEGQSPTATNTMNYSITKEELLSVPSWREYNPEADMLGGEYYCTSVIIIPTLEPSEDYDWNKIHYVICINHKPAFKVEGYSDSLRINGYVMIDCLKCGLLQVHDSGHNMLIKDVTCSTVTIETLK